MLYLGDEPVPHAAPAVEAARADGMRFAFVTNNASRAPGVVAQRLTALGIPAEPQEVVTSAQAAARTLAAELPAGSTVLVVGTDALAQEVEAVGMRPVRTVEQAGQRGCAAVVQGLAPATSWSDLAEAAVALHRGALWVAGNTDATLPTTRGQLPGNGAFVAALQLVTGREPLVAGKPDPSLHRASVERVGARRPIAIGDRLDTDVLGAVRGGADSLLVLTGVVGLPELLQAPAGSRPTYIASDLRGLLHPHPDVQVDGESARCRAAVARYVAGVVRLEASGADDARLDGSSAEEARLDASGGGDDGAGAGGAGDDGARALAALAWACADRGLPVRLG